MKQNVGREKKEQRYGGNTHRKDAIGDLTHLPSAVFVAAVIVLVMFLLHQMIV